MTGKTKKIQKCFFLQRIINNFAENNAGVSFEEMKREPSESLGQSRCCEPTLTAQTTSHWFLGKTFAAVGKSEDLPA